MLSRKKALALVAVVGLTVVLTPVAAHAGTVKVNAAKAEYAHDSSQFCGVAVDDYFEYEINVYCFGSGSTWFKTKVPGVSGKVTSVQVNGQGDCSGKRVTWTRSAKKWSTLLVTTKNTGDFDCYYKSVVVRFS